MPYREDPIGDEPTYDSIIEDIEALIKLGLIEIKGITEDGQWLYGATEQAERMTQAEAEELIHKQFYDEN